MAEERKPLIDRTYMTFKKTHNLVRHGVEGWTSVDQRRLTFSEVTIIECRDEEVTYSSLGAGWLCASLLQFPQSGPPKGILSIDIMVDDKLAKQIKCYGIVAMGETMMSSIYQKTHADGTKAISLTTIVCDRPESHLSCIIHHLPPQPPMIENGDFTSSAIEEQSSTSQPPPPAQTSRKRDHDDRRKKSNESSGSTKHSNSSSKTSSKERRRQEDETYHRNHNQDTGTSGGSGNNSNKRMKTHHESNVSSRSNRENDIGSVSRTDSDTGTGNVNTDNMTFMEFDANMAAAALMIPNLGTDGACVLSSDLNVNTDLIVSRVKSQNDRVLSVSCRSEEVNETVERESKSIQIRSLDENPVKNSVQVRVRSLSESSIEEDSRVEDSRSNLENSRLIENEVRDDSFESDRQIDETSNDRWLNDQSPFGFIQYTDSEVEENLLEPIDRPLVDQNEQDNRLPVESVDECRSQDDRVNDSTKTLISQLCNEQSLLVSVSRSAQGESGESEVVESGEFESGETVMDEELVQNPRYSNIQTEPSYSENSNVVPVQTSELGIPANRGLPPNSQAIERAVPRSPFSEDYVSNLMKLLSDCNDKDINKSKYSRDTLSKKFPTIYSVLSREEAKEATEVTSLSPQTQKSTEIPLNTVRPNTNNSIVFQPIQTIRPIPVCEIRPFVSVSRMMAEQDRLLDDPQEGPSTSIAEVRPVRRRRGRGGFSLRGRGVSGRRGRRVGRWSSTTGTRDLELEAVIDRVARGVWTQSSESESDDEIRDPTFIVSQSIRVDSDNTPPPSPSQSPVALVPSTPPPQNTPSHLSLDTDGLEIISEHVTMSDEAATAAASLLDLELFDQTL